MERDDGGTLRVEGVVARQDMGVAIDVDGDPAGEHEGEEVLARLHLGLVFLTGAEVDADDVESELGVRVPGRLRAQGLGAVLANVVAAEAWEQIGQRQAQDPSEPEQDRERCVRAPGFDVAEVSW